MRGLGKQPAVRPSDALVGFYSRLPVMDVLSDGGSAGSQAPSTTSQVDGCVLVGTWNSFSPLTIACLCQS